MKEVSIRIEIDENGGITADAEGFSGGACLRDLERLLEGLGAATESLTRKPDAGETQATRHAGRKQKAGRRS